MSFRSASKALERSYTFTSLELNGGYDTDCISSVNKGVDLLVQGGAHIKKSLSVNGNVCVEGLIYGDTCGNILTQRIQEKYLTEGIDIIGETRFEGDILPSEDKTYDIGSMTKKWDKIFVQDLTVCGTLNANVISNVTTTLVSAGIAVGTNSIVNDGVGPNLAVKGIVAGTNITITTTAEDITINSTNSGAATTLTSAGAGVGTTTLVSDGTGPTLSVKGLIAGSGISLTQLSNTDVIITNTSTAPTITLSNAGTAPLNQSLVNDGTGPTLATKALVAGTNITLSSNATDITIDSATTTLSNAGLIVGGASLVNDGTGPSLATKALVAGSGITISSNATDVTINATAAPTTTLTNAGVGNNLVSDGTGPTLSVKGLIAGSGISITNTGNVDYTIASTVVVPTITLATSGTGIGTTTLVNDGTGPSLAVKGLIAGNGIIFNVNSNDITIVSNVQTTTLASAGTGIGTNSLVNDGLGPDLAIKGLIPGNGISLTTDANDIIISSTIINTSLSNAGIAAGTNSLVNDGTGPTLAVKGIVAGSGIIVTSNATDVTITSNVVNNTTLTSAGTGIGTTSLVNDGIGPTLAVKGLIAGAGITFITDATDITINSNAMMTTLTSAGTAPMNVSLVNDGTGPSLAVKALVAGNGITFTQLSNTDIVIDSSFMNSWVGNATSNLNMNSYIISNVSSEFVSNINSFNAINPININNDLLLNNTPNGGSILFQSGISIGDNTTTISTPSSIAIGKGAISNAVGAIALGNVIANQINGFFVSHRAIASGLYNNAAFNGNELVEISSSVRFKQNIRDLEEVSNKIDKIRPVRYNAKPGYGDIDKEVIGMIAEELEEVFPEFVTKNQNGDFTGICYDHLVAVLIKEIQSMRKREKERDLVISAIINKFALSYLFN